MESWWIKFICCKARDKTGKDDGEWMEPIPPNRRISDNSATEPPKGVLKRESDLSSNSSKSRKSRKSVHWDHVVDNMGGFTLESMNSERFDQQVVDSVKNSVMRDDYVPRQSMFSMGSLFSEDSISRDLGGFNRSKRTSRISDVSMMSLEDDGEEMNRRGSLDSVVNVGDLEDSVQVLPAVPVGNTTPSELMKRISEGDEDSDEDVKSPPEATPETPSETKHAEVQVLVPHNFDATQGGLC